MSVDSQCVGRVVMTLYGTGGERGLEEAISYLSEPSVYFHGGGSWSAILCRTATIEETAKYWMLRALAAETKAKVKAQT